MFMHTGNSNVNSVKQQEFVVDYVADIDKLPTTVRGARYPFTEKYPNPVPMGSMCYVIASGERYILSSNTDVNWVKYDAGRVMDEPSEDPDTPTVPDEPETPTPPVSNKKTVYFGLDGVMEEDWDDERGRDTAYWVADRPINTYFTKEILTTAMQQSTIKDMTAAELKGAKFTIAENGPDSGGPSTNFLSARITLAFPKSFGTLKSFTFGPFEYTDLDRGEINIDGEEYYCICIGGAVLSNYAGDYIINMN